MGARKMHMRLYALSSVAFLSCLLGLPRAAAQVGTGTINGTVTDADHDVLPAAPVKLEPGDTTVKTNDQGEFAITNGAPGTYTLTVTYVGFSPSETPVTVAAGQVANANPVLQVASQDTEIVVTAGRSYGEAEAVNETLAAENILNIIPDPVIRSIP